MDISFSQLVDDFIDWAKSPSAGYSKRWTENVIRIIEAHRKRWGKMLLENITPAVVQKWFNKRSNEISSSTLVNEVATLRQAFKIGINQ